MRRATLQRYGGDIPPAGSGALAELVTMIAELNRIAGSVPAAQPWPAPQAAAWDRQTIGQWMTERMQTDEARDLGALAVRSVYGDEADQISLLDLLASITGVGGDYNTLIGSAQSIRFVGGPQRLSERLARRLGARVQLGHIAATVRQRARVTITHSHGEVIARRAILTLPKPLLARLEYDPPLPAAHDQNLQRQPMGSVVKVNVIYRTPFWRRHGLNGQVLSDTGPIRLTYDNSPPGGRPGVLVGFMEGDDSRRFYGASPAARRHAALQALARYFGPEALRPVRYVDLAWASETFTRGAYGSFNPPGVLTSLRDAVAEPTGLLHFAGGTCRRSGPATWTARSAPGSVRRKRCSPGCDNADLTAHGQPGRSVVAFLTEFRGAAAAAQLRALPAPYLGPGEDRYDPYVYRRPAGIGTLVADVDLVAREDRDVRHLDVEAGRHGDLRSPEHADDLELDSVGSKFSLREVDLTPAEHVHDRARFGHSPASLALAAAEDRQDPPGTVGSLADRQSGFAGRERGRASGQWMVVLGGHEHVLDKPLELLARLGGEHELHALVQLIHGKPAARRRVAQELGSTVALGIGRASRGSRRVAVGHHGQVMRHRSRIKRRRRPYTPTNCAAPVDPVAKLALRGNRRG